MNWISRLWQRKRLEHELDKEVAYHLERMTADLMASGLEHGEALRQAKLRLGGVDQTKELCRDARGTQWLHDFFSDCRYGIRMLRRSPAFTGAAVASLALGIGANTAIFSLIDLVVMRSLPVREPAQLVEFHQFHPKYGRGAFSYPMFEQMARELDAFQGLLAVTSNSRREVRFSDQPETAGVQLVSASYYHVLGITAATGSLFGRADAPVAVISYDYWQKRFGGNPAAIGAHFQINETVFTIVGVEPRGFTGLSAGQAPNITLPLNMDGEVRGGKSWLRGAQYSWLWVMGRLRQDRTIDSARSELKNFSGRIAAERPESGRRIELAPAANGLDELRQQFSQPLAILMCVVGLVLLIACANLANLLLARSAARQREIAVRLAMGAGRARVIRQWLTEGLLLAAAGGTLGVILAYWLGNGLVTMMSNDGPRIALEIHPDLRVLLFASALALISCLLFSLAPAIQVTRAAIQPALAQARSAHWRLGKSLIVAQAALSLLLLIGAGLFARTLVNVYSLDSGFDRHGVLLFSLDTSRSGAKGPHLRDAQQRLLQDLRALPGVTGASLSVLPPISGGGWDGNVFVEGYTHAADEDSRAHLNAVAPDYFRTIGASILLGRDIDERDGPVSQKVAVVNETFARYYFKGGSPVGKWISMEGPDRSRIQIVGVVRNVKYISLRQDFPRTVYFAAFQDTGKDPPPYTYAIRTGRPEELERSVAARVQAFDPALHVKEMKTLEQHVARSILTERMLATVGGFFGCLGLLVAAVGIYGVMAFQVARRRKEIGIRLAIGATPSQVMRMLLGETAQLLAIAAVIGTAGAVAVTRFAKSMLFGVTPSDPATFVLAVAIVAVTALIAACLSGRVAARLDPIETLRAD